MSSDLLTTLIPKIATNGINVNTTGFRLAVSDFDAAVRLDAGLVHVTTGIVYLTSVPGAWQKCWTSILRRILLHACRFREFCLNLVWC